MKKLFSLLKKALLLYVAYLAVAFSLALFGVIHVVHIVPGGLRFKTSGYVAERDQMILSFEQPIVEYSDNSIIVRSIGENKDGFSKDIAVFKETESISITVAFDGQQMTVPIVNDYAIEKDAYELPKKAIVISDIEGNFADLVRFLRGTKVIDEKNRWALGAGHLIVLGDIFDRGKYVNECLWLLYKLEQEAELAGGKVHVILGNHEAMNLVGVHEERMFKYVNGKYYANAQFLDFDYQNWYSRNTELGLWLRSKNAIERIGDYLFVHAGVSPVVARSGLTITEINNGIRRTLDKAPKVYTEDEHLLFGKKGPLWYRGIAIEKVSNSDLESILSTYKAKTMVFGHTIINSRISSLYDGKALAIDLPHAKRKTISGLLIDSNGLYEIDEAGKIKAIDI